MGSLGGQAVIVHISSPFKRLSQRILGQSRQAGYAEGRPAECRYGEREQQARLPVVSGQWPQNSIGSEQAAK